MDGTRAIRLDELQAAAKDNCQFCLLLHESIGDLSGFNFPVNKLWAQLNFSREGLQDGNLKGNLGFNTLSVRVSPLLFKQGTGPTGPISKLASTLRWFPESGELSHLIILLKPSSDSLKRLELEIYAFAGPYTQALRCCGSK